MENETKFIKSTIPSVLQSNETFSSKILARESIVDSFSSARFFYQADRGDEGVPFQWEKRPGKPIMVQPNDILLPITPPPAVLAMSLPKPSMNLMGEPNPRRWLSAWLVKKIKKIKPSRKICNDGLYPNFGSDRDVCESDRFSMSSSASTSTSSSNVSSNGYQRSKALLHGRPFTCGLPFE